MKRLISTITLIIFLFAAQTQPAFAIRSEQLAENRYHLRSGNGARAGGEAEQAARQLLRWAELTLKSERDEPLSEPEQSEFAALKPPVWGENLTPEVYCYFQRDFLLPANQIRKFETPEVIDRKNRIMIAAIFEKAGIEYDDFMRQIVPVKGMVTEEHAENAMDLMEKIADEDVVRVDEVYEAGMQILEEVRRYEWQNSLHPATSPSPIVKTLAWPQQILMEKGLYSNYLWRHTVSSIFYHINMGRLKSAFLIFRRELDLHGCSEANISRVAGVLAELAILSEGHRIITLRESIDGHEAGEEMTLAEVCCHVAWNLKKQGVWDEFVKEVERRRGEIEVDEADGRVTFRITLPRALQVEEQEVDVDAVGERELETTL